MTTQRMLEDVSAERLREDLFHLSSAPLPYRKVNFTVEGHDVCSLDEADSYIREQLAAVGLPVATTPSLVVIEPPKPNASVAPKLSISMTSGRWDSRACLFSMLHMTPEEEMDSTHAKS